MQIINLRSFNAIHFFNDSIALINGLVQLYGRILTLLVWFIILIGLIVTVFVQKKIITKHIDTSH